MRASAMLSVAVAATAAALSLTLVQPAPRASAATLDRVDAAGVTEVGGSAAYARMLPRTGPDGLLSATLLPPVADWGSKPVTNIYYVSANAASGDGNGSPQHPFKSLGTALSSVSSSSAFILAPATYSASFTLAPGRSVAICGFGSSSYISSLTVTASGSSADTTLCLYGVRVGTLTVNGNRVNLRLMQAYVGRLAGSASAATVTRADMGSVVYVSTLAHADVYDGYDTAPLAEALTGPGLMRLFLSGGRVFATVDDETNTVAYLSDVAAATNSAFGAVQELRAEDLRLAGLILSEAGARAAADLALSNTMAAADAALLTRVQTVGSTWGSQMLLLSGRMDGMAAQLDGLRTKETNDVAALAAAVASVRTDFASADAALDSDLRNAIASGVAGLRAEVPGIADVRFDYKLGLVRGDIVNAAVTQAVAQADSRAQQRDNVLSARITGLSGDVARLSDGIETNRTALSTLRDTVRTLGEQVVNVSNNLYVTQAGISNLVSYTIMPAVRTTYSNQNDIVAVSTNLAELSSDTVWRINSIIDCLNIIKSNQPASSMSVPSKIAH